MIFRQYMFFLFSVTTSEAFKRDLGEVVGNNGEGTSGEVKHQATPISLKIAAVACLFDCCLFIRLKKFIATCFMTCIAAKVHLLPSMNLKLLQDHTSVKRSFHFFPAKQPWLEILEGYFACSGYSISSCRPQLTLSSMLEFSSPRCQV